MSCSLAVHSQNVHVYSEGEKGGYHTVVVHKRDLSLKCAGRRGHSQGCHNLEHHLCSSPPQKKTLKRNPYLMPSMLL